MTRGDVRGVTEGDVRGATSAGETQAGAGASEGAAASSAEGVSGTQAATAAGQAATPAGLTAVPGQAAQGGVPQGPFASSAEMQQQIEALRATVELAARQGLAQAKIALEPEELGAVRVHITQTSQGLIARVSADSAAGAQAIASGQSDLRGALSSLGVSLLRLDIGSSTQGGGQQAQAQAQAQQQASTATTRRVAAEAVAEVDELAATPALQTSDPSKATSSRLRTVDVLA